MLFKFRKAEKEIPTFIASSISVPPEAVDLGYAVDSDLNAENCEFFIDSFGKGSWAKAMYHVHWIEAHYSINLQQPPGHPFDFLVSTGLYVNHSPKGSKQKVEEGYYLGEEVSPGQHKVFMSYELDYQNGRQEVCLRQQINAIAFFIDIHRHNTGKIERLWIRNQGNNYTLGEIFDGFPTHDRSAGLGSITYVEQPSPIYNQKTTCLR